MTTYKVNVSLPPELVSDIDEIAAELGLSRSGFIAEASARYLADLKNLSAEELRRREIGDAMERMKELGKKIPKDFDYVKVIREFREDRRIW